MEYPSAPNPTCFLIEPSKKYTTHEKTKKSKYENPPHKPGLEYRHMIEWKHKGAQYIGSYFWYRKHLPKNYPPKKILFEEWIPKHNIEKYEEKCCFIDMSRAHTRTDCLPIYIISKKEICSSDNEHWKQPESDSEFPSISFPYSELPDGQIGKISNTQRNEEKEYNL